MRSGIIFGIAAVLGLLQGCGRKGPLMLPAPQAQQSEQQAADQQKPAEPSLQQGKQP